MNGIRLGFSAIAGAFLLFISLASCEEELDTLGEGVIGNDPFVTDSIKYDVFAFNKSVTAIQTNRLPLYRLGSYNDPVYGRTEASITAQVLLANGVGNPTFGNFTQAVENGAAGNDPTATDTIPEDERLVSAILNIPYQLVEPAISDRDGDRVPDEFDADPDDPNSDTDMDGVSDIDESASGRNPLSSDEDNDGTPDVDDEDVMGNRVANNFALDSIFTSRTNPPTPLPGDRRSDEDAVGATFNLTVEESTFFLQDLDPSDFLMSEGYLSDRGDEILSFSGQVLASIQDTISNSEHIIRFSEDDPETEDVDETKLIETRIPPGIRVELDSLFFQENIIKKEGSFELLSNANFTNFFRGIHITIDSGNEDLLMLLDLTQATIELTYLFDDSVVVDGERQASDEPVERTYTLNLLLGVNTQITGGNAVNHLEYDPLDAEITSRITTNDTINADRLYVRGGAGNYSILRLFGEDGGEDEIQEIRDNNWVVNEASLVFYVDQTALNVAPGSLEPPRLFLFNSSDNTPLYNIATDIGNSISSLEIFPDYDGVLQSNSQGGEKYRFRLTQYLNDIIVRDSTNHDLILTTSSNVSLLGTQEAMIANTNSESNANTADYPVMAAINPFGTVLFGNLDEGDANFDKRLQLEIIYTELDR